MNRGLERKLLIAGSIWNALTAIVTLFGYSTWFKQTGLRELQNSNPQTVIVGTTLIDSVSKVIVTFGLLMFVGAIVNFIVARSIQDSEIQKKILVWIACWGLLQLLFMDVVGFLIYMVAFIVYMAKNKAVRLSQA